MVGHRGGSLRPAIVAAWIAMAGIVWPAAAVERGTVRGIAFAQGGVGLDEREEMRAIERDYNVKLVTAVDEANAFLAQVHVDIHQGDRLVFDRTIDGPWLLMRLAPGQYVITANASSVLRRRTLTVPAQGRVEAVIVWSARELERAAR